MKVLVPLANGSEEMEAIILVDVLRRANWEVVIAGLSEGSIEASRGVQILPDCSWEEVNPALFDMLLLPGGWNGTLAFCAHKGLCQALQSFDQQKKWIAAICAAPLALHAAGILEGRSFTCYPGVEKELPAHFQRKNHPVVIDGHLLTSQGPGTAFEFALSLLSTCGDPTTAQTVREGLLL
jgi:4-methyl-5(b-hydroxyethyl)-thiazole monophosphate biosynthesis